MKRCPSCNYENIATSTYCERCGSSLAPSSSTEPTYSNPVLEYTSPSFYDYPPRTEKTLLPPPPPSEYIQMPLTTFPPLQTSSYRRSFGGSIFSVALYVLGTFFLALGLAGGVLHDAASAVIGIVFLSTCMLSLVVLILLLIYRRRPYLRWWVRLLLEIGLIFLIFVAFFIAYIVQSSTNAFSQMYLQDVVLGYIFVVYGIFAAFVAFW